jgi:hypothetical protein
MTMSQIGYVKHEVISLKDHPQFNEAWLRDLIEKDPSILGLGELEVIGKERMQPRAGRLDLLLRDPDAGKRYEVEIQLGATDESHIIRCLEYWDIERKRYPQYDHCAVLVAEDITSRFLNVVSLFNGLIPLVAIKVSCLLIGEQVTVSFVKVLDEVRLGEEEEEDVAQTADRAYWVSRASEDSLKVVDQCLDLIRKIVPTADIKYNRYYIGLTEHGEANNFIRFRPRRKNVRWLQARIGDMDAWAQRLEEAGLTVLPGGRTRGLLTVSITTGDLDQHAGVLRELIECSYNAQEE